jgi:shikimate dehydrogenase
MNREFVDLDEEIEAAAGKSIPQIFAEEGEAAFRQMETQAALQAGKRPGLVIAAGGGAILKRENVRALLQNGVICLVRRPVEKLATQGRPLSAGLEALRKMEAERGALYAACADYAVDSQPDKAMTAKAIVEGFYEAVGAERAEPEHAGDSGKASVRNPDL